MHTLICSFNCSASHVAVTVVRLVCGVCDNKYKTGQQLTTFAVGRYSRKTSVSQYQTVTPF